MTANQYRQAIAAMGLSRQRAADFLGISLRTSQGYALGEHPIPEVTAKLLRLMVRLELTPEEVE